MIEIFLNKKSCSPYLVHAPRTGSNIISIAQFESVTIFFLVTYLTKHKQEIIDYELRQKSGKPIEGGRMEKAVDQVIGLRQKRKGTSWRFSGSKALAILKTVELNVLWKRFCFSTTS